MKGSEKRTIEIKKKKRVLRKGENLKECKKGFDCEKLNFKTVNRRKAKGNERKE